MNSQSEQYNQWQSNPKFHNQNNQLTDGIYYDGIIHQLEDDIHQFIANSPIPDSSYPHQEPWFDGPPSLSYYTQVDLPIHLLGYGFQCGMDTFNDSIINIPKTGKCDHPIIKLYIGHIIGPLGQHLKTITETTGVHYIWYNENPKDASSLPPWGCFQLWGRPERLPNAVNMLQTHIQYITQQFKIN